MVNFLVDFIVITLLISLGIGTGHYKLVALPFPYLLCATAPQLLLTWVGEKFTDMHYFCKISSMTRNEKLRNAVYTIVEDVCAVDGGYGKEYRLAFDERYRASKEIRDLISLCGFLWGLGATIVGVACVIVIALVDIRVVEWVMGWIVPPVFAGVTAFLTIRITRATLMRESQNWGTTGL